MPVKIRHRESQTEWKPRDGNGLPAAREPAPPRGWYSTTKDVVEFVAAAVLLVLAAPVILLLAALVRLTSSGPAFYSQTRLGRGGRPYQLYKLRTMFHDCEKLSGPRWSTPGDPRVTWLGGILRRTHLDELPQLWNVLKGDMSLVGPRPERPEFVSKLEQLIPHYGDRLAVRPGVTGLAQIQLPADTDLASVRRKTAYDLYYIHHASLWLDARIIVLTAFYAAGSQIRWPFRLLGMPSPQAIEGEYQQRCSVLPTAPPPVAGTMPLLVPPRADNGLPLTGPHMIVDVAPGI